MFKFIRSKRYRQIKEARELADKERHQALEQLEIAQEKLDELLKENNELSDEVDKLNNLFNNASEVSVKLDIDKDLQKVTPTIKFNEQIFDKLVELGYLNDSQKGHTFSIQLALILIANEALEQIIETYKVNIDDGD